MVEEWRAVLHMETSFFSDFTCNLSQLVMEPTCYNHVLDLLPTSHPSIISDISIIPGISDHEAITFKITICIAKKMPNHSQAKGISYHKANLDEVKTRSLQTTCRRKLDLT